MATILCVLYDDPVTGYPPEYARDDIPEDRALLRWAGDADSRAGSTSRRVSSLAVCQVSSGLRTFLEERGHRFIVTSDKDGPTSVFEHEL